MKVKLDDEVLFEIDDTMIKLLAHDLLDPIEEIKRRLQWVIQHKCERSYARLKDEWFENLMKDPEVKSIPATKREFVNMVFEHPDYLNRLQKENKNNE